ncbi:MAG: hypothetical protein ACXVWT_04055 [Solirubrobacteraceae bacterium]
MNADAPPASTHALDKRPALRPSESVLSTARRVPPAVAVGLLCLAATLLADAVLKHESGLRGDDPYYERMATHPAGPHTFPYAYRVAVPWVVHILPFSHTASFTLLACLSLSATGGVLFTLLRIFDVGPRLSVALVVGLVLSPAALVVILRHGRNVDPESLLVLTLGTLFIVRRQKLALGITMLIGATVRESSLFLIPFAYAVWAERLFDRQALKDTAIVSALPAILYLFMRTSIDARGKEWPGTLVTARWHVIKEALGGGGSKVEARRMAYVFGPIWVVAPFALLTLRFARRSLVLVALCAVSMTFALDWGRVIFLAAPVFYIAAGHVIKDRRRLAIATVTLLLAMDLGYAIYMQAYGVSHGLDAPLVPTERVY